MIDVEEFDGITIDILGERVRVETRELASGQLGEALPTKNLIVLNENLTDPVPVLLHEVMEYGTDLLGYDFGGNDPEHRLLCAMERCMVAACRSNRAVFSRLWEPTEEDDSVVSG